MIMLIAETKTVQTTIRTMTRAHWETVRDIYEQGLASGQATFETEAPDWAKWDRTHLTFGRLIAEWEHRVVGWAALSPVSHRSVYAGVAENSIYVHECARGQGVGQALLWNLARLSEQAGIWTLQATVFPENTASIAVHKRCGFRVVGRRERVAKLRGEWRDVLMLERRSTVAGS